MVGVEASLRDRFDDMVGASAKAQPLPPPMGMRRQRWRGTVAHSVPSGRRMTTRSGVTSAVR